MRILLLGKNGQVGWELQRALAPLGELIALDRSGAPGLIGALTELPGLRRTIESLRPDVVVNAAAYTAVDAAEDEGALAHLVNAAAPGVIADALGEFGGLLVHYSTDYVFDGSGQHWWKENDVASPLSVYGASKLQGEKEIFASGCAHLIFRTGWVYGAHGKNFAKTILKAAESKKELKVVADQYGAPTGSELIADVTAHCIRAVKSQRNLTGIYNLVADGTVSWHGYASFIVDEARRLGKSLAVEDLLAVSSVDYPTKAQRPKNSRLDCQKIKDTFGIYLPDWQYGVARMLSEIIGDRHGA